MAFAKLIVFFALCAIAFAAEVPKKVKKEKTQDLESSSTYGLGYASPYGYGAYGYAAPYGYGKYGYGVAPYGLGYGKYGYAAPYALGYGLGSGLGYKKVIYPSYAYAVHPAYSYGHLGYAHPGYYTGSAAYYSKPLYGGYPYGALPVHG